MSNPSTHQRQPDDAEGLSAPIDTHHAGRDDPIPDGRLMPSRPTFICIGSPDRAGIATDANEKGTAGATSPPVSEEEELKYDARKREAGLALFDEEVRTRFNISPDTECYATSLFSVTSSDISRMGVKTEVLTFSPAADLMNRVHSLLDGTDFDMDSSRPIGDGGGIPTVEPLSQRLAHFWDELSEEKYGTVAVIRTAFKNISPETEARAEFIVTHLHVKLTIFCDEQGIANMYAFPELALSSAPPEDSAPPGTAKTFPANMVVIQHGQHATMVSDIATALVTDDTSEAQETKGPRGVSIQAMTYQAVAQALARMFLRRRSTGIANPTDSDTNVQLFVATTGVVWVFGWVEGGVLGKEDREAYIIPMTLRHHFCPSSKRSLLAEELKSVFLFLACWTFVAPTTLVDTLKSSAIKTSMPKSKTVGTMSF